MSHHNENLGDLLQRLSASDQSGVSSLARSILDQIDDNGLKSLSSDGEMSASDADTVTQTENGVDPFSTDVNVNALLALGILEEADKTNLEYALSKLAGVVCTLRSELRQIYTPDSDANRDLDQARVQQFTTHYMESLKGKAYLEVMYDDPFAFSNLVPEEAAGLAIALRQTTKVDRELWMQLSNTGRSKP